jgi:hypothetical protein
MAAAAVGLTAQLGRLHTVGGVAVRANDVQGFGHGSKRVGQQSTLHMAAGARRFKPHPSGLQQQQTPGTRAQRKYQR